MTCNAGTDCEKANGDLVHVCLGGGKPKPFNVCSCAPPAGQQELTSRAIDARPGSRRGAGNDIARNHQLHVEVLPLSEEAVDSVEPTEAFVLELPGASPVPPTLR